ncbi:Glu-tRNA(Gln) amidotransferase GatDE subunit D [Candidatus Woesearchaeota archaeon CG10_big_fil_rev_8_21_14_0_10_30_7]|nr:MAG: Glu-tRNA(Gln) amidotransferase GatDE subunit D [Candidatus Woesearchaeota archaeon CG10_big_fil_rev_8_21_14_0_10_30_7]
MAEFQLGDFVKIRTEDVELEGKYVPSEDTKFFVLKLDSGYNISIPKRGIEGIELIKKNEVRDQKKAKAKLKKELPTISILHTGGTISSKVSYDTGAVYNEFTPEELLELFPELHDMANISSFLVSNMSSDDVRFAHYNILAKAVEAEVKKGVKGIIITHGTDTLHYSSAALSFALENLPIPVLLVGAQRSSDRGSSDAAVNLICAVNFIINTKYAGVAVCMHERSGDNTCIILPGTKCRKMHSSKRNAFKPINVPPIAKVNFEDKKIIVFQQKLPKLDGKFTLKLFKEKLKVGIIKVHTNMYASQFSSFKNFNGLIIEGTGLGHAPINKTDKHTSEHEKIFKELTNLTKKMPVAMSTQTIYGIVDMNVYTPGRRLLEIGVLGNYTDMTPETAFIKLAWLLSNQPKQVKELYNKNVRGEISERLN